jgi:NIMA (never in mitosis gene a)-related kinase
MATNQLSLALKIKEGKFKRIPSKYSEELQRVIRWMLQTEPGERPNVEDLLNLPRVSMRLRERALKRNL